MKDCSTCGKPHNRAGQSYCAECHAAYMRSWRLTHPLTDEQRKKDTCRSYTNVLIRRGRLNREPCSVCGVEPAQAHHPDYSQPRLVVWLCKQHHREHHAALTT